jgi:hypothetical protein
VAEILLVVALPALPTVASVQILFQVVVVTVTAALSVVTPHVSSNRNRLKNFYLQKFFFFLLGLEKKERKVSVSSVVKIFMHSNN